MKLVMLTLDGPDAKENRNRIATLLQFNIAGDERVIPVLEQNAKQEALLNKAARDSILAEAASENPGAYNTRVRTELQQPIVGFELIFKEIQDMSGGDGDDGPCVDRDGGKKGKLIIPSYPGSHPSLPPSLSLLPSLHLQQISESAAAALSSG